MEHFKFIQTILITGAFKKVTRLFASINYLMPNAFKKGCRVICHNKLFNAQCI